MVTMARRWTFGFNAIDFTGWTPPDPEIAVGPNHLVAMTNGAIAFFDKQGNLLFQDEIEDSFGFWGAQGAGNFVFDPECLYDPHSGRFFAMANERSGGSFFLLAVSDDSDPNGVWHKYRFQRTIDSDIDSPNMGIDEDYVYLTADFFGPDKYEVVIIEKAPILSGGALNITSTFFTGSGNQSMGVPIIYDTNQPAGFLLQSSEGTGQRNRLQRGALPRYSESEHQPDNHVHRRCCPDVLISEPTTTGGARAIVRSCSSRGSGARCTSVSRCGPCTM